MLGDTPEGGEKRHGGDQRGECVPGAAASQIPTCQALQTATCVAICNYMQTIYKCTPEDKEDNAVGDVERRVAGPSARALYMPS